MVQVSKRIEVSIYKSRKDDVDQNEVREMNDKLYENGFNCFVEIINTEDGISVKLVRRDE